MPLPNSSDINPTEKKTCIRIENNIQAKRMFGNNVSQNSRKLNQKLNQ